MCTIFKVFIESVTMLLLFFGPEAWGILIPQAGMEPTPSALKSKVLTTRRPGKSLKLYLGDSLPKSSGSSLGWGALSGLRPTVDP